MKYLTAMLNSKLLSWAFKNFYAGGGPGATGYRYKKVFLEKLPIIKPTTKNKTEVQRIENIINEIIDFKETDNTTDITEQIDKIDKLVYQLYELTEEEIALIENTK